LVHQLALRYHIIPKVHVCDLTLFFSLGVLLIRLSISTGPGVLRARVFEHKTKTSEWPSTSLAGLVLQAAMLYFFGC